MCPLLRMMDAGWPDEHQDESLIAIGEQTRVFHDFFNWLQSVPGATGGDPSTSWSQQFAGSLNLWSLCEATHVLALMLFAGTILLVDLRMLGLAFKTVPYSTLNNKVLPMTVVGFALLVLTGLILFAGGPVKYYHSVWFRAKVIFLLAAAANIFWFHYRTQKTQAEWDASPNPPMAVKVAAALSLTSWILVIVFGRLIAFTWFDCDRLKPNSFGYAFAECASQMRKGVRSETAEVALEPHAGNNAMSSPSYKNGAAASASLLPPPPPPGRGG
jgi:hypothetical protein